MSDSVSAGKLEESGALQLSGIIIIVFIMLLFILVLLVIIFRLYTIRFHFWNHRTASRSSDLPTLQHGQGLDPAILRSIKVIQISAAQDKLGLECSVCLSQVSQGEKARFLPKCNHGFHMQCIDVWFHSHNTCPLCRNVVTTVSSDDLEAVAVDAGGGSPDSRESNASSSAPSSSGVTNDSHLAIDIPSIQTAEDDHKSPVTPTVALYRSLSRLLSRNS